MTTMPTAAWVKAENKPLDPRTRALVLALRRALLIVVDALGEYAGLEARAKAA